MILQHSSMYTGLCHSDNLKCVLKPHGKWIFKLKILHYDSIRHTHNSYGRIIGLLALACENWFHQEFYMIFLLFKLILKQGSELPLLHSSWVLDFGRHKQLSVCRCPGLRLHKVLIISEIPPPWKLVENEDLMTMPCSASGMFKCIHGFFIRNMRFELQDTGCVGYWYSFCMSTFQFCLAELVLILSLKL